MLAIAIFLVISPATIIISTATADTIQVTIPEDVLPKIGADVIDVISTGREDTVIDAIIACDIESNADYLERATESVNGLSIAQNWKQFHMFRAEVSVDQLFRLARLPFVTRIDNNTWAKVACMDTARYYTDVDLVEQCYPSLDGNADGSTTTYSKDDIVIAILDSGIDTGHEDLPPEKVIGWIDIIGDEDHNPHGTAYDDFYHGTFCASIAAGTGDATYSYRGVARYAALVGVKMIDYQGWTNKSTAISALEWVADNKNTYGIEVVSCSWGFFDYGDYDTVAQAADDLVYYSDLVVCVAAGNEGTNGIRPPGTAKWVITVGSVADPGEGGWSIDPYSGQGPCADGRIKPDVVAPGIDIMAAKKGTTNQYEERSGTSYATPFVAGIVALFLDEYPLLRYDYDADNNPDIKQLLMASAVDVPGDTYTGKDNIYGAGRVDALAEYNFINQDVSTWSSDALLMISYQDQSAGWGNEPLWCRDNNYRTDWFKVNVYSGWFLWAQALGDPDLLLQVCIYDQYLNLKASSTVGRNRNVGYTTTYSGVYYVRVQSQQYTGDYYDIEIVTTPS